MNIKELNEKYKDVILYLIFGIGTTIVNVLVFWMFAYLTDTGTMASTVIAWIAAVIFAYLTNRKWVFRSEVREIGGVIREIVAFFSCRFMTGIVDILIMWIFAEMAGLSSVIVKAASNILVIILNYIASKLVIFRRKAGSEK